MQRDQSAFFVLNVWEEEFEGARIEWRGELLRVDTGAVLRFEDWPEMVEYIAGALDTLRLQKAMTSEQWAVGSEQ